MDAEPPGRLLRQARCDRGLSLAALSARTGVNISTLSRYENGRQQPSYVVLARLLRALGVQLTGRPLVTDERGKALVLERVCGLGMALPRKERGALTYPPFRTLGPR